MRLAVMLETLERAAAVMPGLLAVGGALALGKLVFDRTLGLDGRAEVEDRRNAAFGVVYAAYFVALALAMAGSLYGRAGLSIWVGAAKVLGECAVVVLLVRISLWVNDRLILSRFSVNREVGEDQNPGAAFCVAGALLASGLTINGALTGFSQGFWQGLRDIVIYWALGQVILVAGSRLYEWTAPFDIHRVIELDGNRAVGLSFGGFLAALGIVTRASIVGTGVVDAAGQPLSPITDEALRTLTIAAVGVGLLVSIRFVVNLALLRRSSLQSEVYLDDNLAAGALAMGGYLAAAIVLAASLHR